jgi:hypothetical protein
MLIDALTILHAKVVELVFHISDWIMWTKVGLKLLDRLLEVIHPERTECWIFHLEQVWFEPL